MLDPSDLKSTEDVVLAAKLKSLCSEITDVDIEELKLLRNIIEEVLSRWENCRFSLGAEE